MLALVYRAAEYAAPSWRRNTHTKKLDAALNDTLPIASGCLKLTRRELLSVLTGIPPAHLRREHSTFKLALQAQLNTNHPLHTLVQSVQFIGTQCLRSRRPFHGHAAALLNSELCFQSFHLSEKQHNSLFCVRACHVFQVIVELVIGTFVWMLYRCRNDAFKRLHRGALNEAPEPNASRECISHIFRLWTQIVFCPS